MTEDQLKGDAAKTNTTLTFYNSTTNTGAWEVVAESTPILKYFEPKAATKSIANSGIRGVFSMLKPAILSIF